MEDSERAVVKELAQRRRPAVLADVWGNEDVVAALEALVRKKDGRPQTYLFTGPAGTGKTTLARAFCKELGVSGMDLIELNASDRNGVDDVRQLIDTVQYYPIGEARGVILDEAHMMSASAQSAALKLLEEPPAGTYMMLCTTDPQKLSAAVRSRCVRFETAPLPERTLIKELRGLCGEEGLDVGVDLLEMVAEKSEGVPRVALKLLDKIAGMPRGKAEAALEGEFALDVEDPDVRQLCQSLLSGSWRGAAAVLKKLKRQDSEGVRRMVLGYMGAVLLNSGKPEAACAIEAFAEPFYDSGFAGLVCACYGVCGSVKNG